MKHPHSTFTITIALVCCVASTFAAETVDLTVNGTIRPAACNISLSNANIDYGTISAAKFSPNGANALPVRDVDMLIDCDGPSRVAIVASDNRNGTATAPTNLNNFGLGLVANQPLGYFRMTPKNILGDGGAVDTIISTDQGASWTAKPAGWFLDHNPQNRIGWAESGSLSPTAFTDIQMQLEVSGALLGKNSFPTLADGVPLDGSATISLVYL